MNSQGDFCNMEFEDNTFDAAFCFEATCHAGKLVDVYREIARVLKPGSIFVDSDWTVTDSYDPQNPDHVKVHDDIVVSAVYYHTTMYIYISSSCNLA